MANIRQKSTIGSGFNMKSIESFAVHSKLAPGVTPFTISTAE